MSGYKRPCDAPVSSSWADHKARNPPSSEPGTDYACGYGTPILAAESGTVADLSHSNGGGTGRYLAIDLDDGRRVRYLHLSEIWVGVGSRVGRGQAVAASGASGWGSDWGYGAHVHTTLFPGHWHDFGGTLDFDAYVGEDPPPPPPQPKGDTVGTVIAARDSGGHTYYFEGGYVKHLATGAEVQSMLWALDLPGAHQFDDGDFQRAIWGFGLEEYSMGDVLALPAAAQPGGILVASWRDVRDAVAAIPPAEPSSLVVPAWVGSVFLGLVGIVETVRLFIDTLTSG